MIKATRDDITLRCSAGELSPADLDGFFIGWPTPPSTQRSLEILTAADEVILAWNAEQRLVGFVTALTDGTFAAYIALLEVLPPWQGLGIGQGLVVAMLDRLRTCYMIDLVCDPTLIPFYERLGATRLEGMVWRRHAQLR